MANKTFQKLTLAQQIAVLQAFKAGTFHNVTYRKRVSLSPKYGDVVIETETVMQVRFSLEYGDNLSMVKEAHENGMGYASDKGVSSVWAEIVENLIYGNRNTGELAVRAFPFNGSAHSKRYFLNGEETTLDALLEAGYPKSKLVSSGDKKPPVVMLYLKNLLSVA